MSVVKSGRESRQASRCTGSKRSREIAYPTLNRTEAHGPTPGIRAARDIVQHARVRVQRRVDEAHRILPHRQTLLVDAVHDGGEDGRAGRGAALEREVALVEYRDVVAVRRDVGVAAADAVVETAVGAEGGVARVVGVRGVVVGEESEGLVSGNTFEGKSMGQYDGDSSAEECDGKGYRIR